MVITLYSIRTKKLYEYNGFDKDFDIGLGFLAFTYNNKSIVMEDVIVGIPNIYTMRDRIEIHIDLFSYGGMIIKIYFDDEFTIDKGYDILITMMDSFVRNGVNFNFNSSKDKIKN